MGLVKAIRDFFEINCLPIMQIPFESIGAIVFAHAKRDAGTHGVDQSIGLVYLLNPTIAISPDLYLGSSGAIVVFNRLVRVLNQQFVLAIAVKIDEFSVGNTLCSKHRRIINLDSLALAVLFLVLEDLVGEQLVCRLDRRLGRSLGLLLGLCELNVLRGVRAFLGIVDLHGGRALLFALARGDGHLVLLIGQLAKVLHGKAVLAIDLDGVALALAIRRRQLDGIALKLFALAVLGQNLGLACTDNIALATRSYLGRRANTRHNHDSGDNGDNGNTAENGSDDTALVLGLLGLRRRNKRLSGLSRLGHRLLITRLRRHMSRGTLRNVLSRRGGRRRVLHRKRHRLRLALSSAHASPAARAKRGAVGYLSSTLGAIHRISRLSPQPQCARAVLPTTPYGRNPHSCCATLPPQKMIPWGRRKKPRRAMGRGGAGKRL